MRETRIGLVVVALAIFGGGVLDGCGAPTPVRRFQPQSDGPEIIAPADATSTGGASPTGTSDTGGAGTGGASTGGSAGEAGGAGGGAETGGSGGSVETADASTGAGSGGGGAGGSATGGSIGTGGASEARDAASDPRPEAGVAVVGTGGTALCFTDPTVIAICKQLEPACSNCPDQSILNDCYNVAAAGDDRACARYAVTNKCTVDPGGNTCGSLNCRASGCDRNACTAAQGEGNTTMCQPLLASCPCK